MNTTFRRVVVGLTLAVMVGAALILFLTPRSYSAQPYGGCAEAWQAPQSQGAADCRKAGWLVKARLVVGPKGYVRALRVGPCEYEDSRNCYWDAGRMGNGVGNSFVDLRGKAFYVKFRS